MSVNKFEQCITQHVLKGGSQSYHISAHLSRDYRRAVAMCSTLVSQDFLSLESAHITRYYLGFRGWREQTIFFSRVVITSRSTNRNQIRGIASWSNQKRYLISRNAGRMREDDNESCSRILECAYDAKPRNVGFEYMGR